MMNSAGNTTGKVGVGVLFGALVALAASAARADEAQPAQAGGGGAGESCRARADCRAGLKCVAQVCTDEHEGQSCGATSDCGGELKCIRNKCTSGAAHARGGDDGGHGGGSSAAAQEWLAFKLEGVHPFAGLGWSGGFDTVGATGNVSGGFNSFDGAFLFALHGGLFIDQSQLTFEISPFTYVYDGRARGPAFQMNGSYAYFIPMYESEAVQVYWPLRLGVGMVAGGDNTGDLAFFQIRGDVVGAAIKVGHVMLDLHMPSFRYAITDRFGVQGHLLDWLFGLSASYVF